MKKNTVCVVIALLMTVMLSDGFGWTFTRHITLSDASEIAEIRTQVLGSVGRDFLDGLNVRESDVKQSGCYYYKSEDLLKYFFVIHLPNDNSVKIRPGNGEVIPADIKTLRAWFPECPEDVLKRFQKTDTHWEWAQWVESATGRRIWRWTYVLVDGADTIIMGVNWRRNPPTSDGAVVPTGPDIVISPLGTELGQIPPESEMASPAQISEDRKLAEGFVEKLIGRVKDNDPITFKEGLRLFSGPSGQLEFQLLRQLGYTDVSGASLKPYPELSCFGMVLKMNKGLFSSVADEKPIVAVRDLSSSGSTNGTSRVNSYQVVWTYVPKHSVLGAVSAGNQKTIIFDVHVKTFGKGEKRVRVDFGSALINGRKLVHLLGFRNATATTEGGKTITMQGLYHYSDEKLREIEALLMKSMEGDE